MTPRCTGDAPSLAGLSRAGWGAGRGIGYGGSGLDRNGESAARRRGGGDLSGGRRAVIFPRTWPSTQVGYGGTSESSGNSTVSQPRDHGQDQTGVNSPLPDPNLKAI